ELPEVETTVKGLQKVLSRTFVYVWVDSKKTIKKPVFKKFEKEIKNKKINKIWRRGKNIIFGLSGGYSLLVHQKLTGHLLVGNWELGIGNWEPLEKGALGERVNRYIHLIFRLDNGLMLALSDLRKFAKVELWKTEELLNSKEFRNLGPEPLSRNFTFEKFKNLLINKKAKIKQILMDQNIIAGIGNIYSDEILWRAKIHPFRSGAELNEKELKDIYKYIKLVLNRAIKLKGTSVSDYRDTKGEEGQFKKMIKVYQRENEKCFRCGTEIKRVKMGGRSAHFCPFCQQNKK
ncbi:MAG: bifunctional DNA-formamidopyrimidine glycosylase/DNA-(apurinic or apyrimidinic site) lyase, partial [bacterium]|nr:bifunctional DNA-formamidopyrimidine glycosylase/DNA-(apurinic or apyrimidinic site) lyase [bacterium]